MKRLVSKKGLEVLAALAGGANLEFQPSPKGYFRAIGKDRGRWVKFERKTLLYAIKTLHKNKFVEIIEEKTGSTQIKLTEEGRAFARKQRSFLSGFSSPKEWDKKWRLIFFDVPEEKKKLRDAFRYQLKKAGLKEFQRSAFIFPYSCFREIEGLAEELGIKEHIVLATAETLSNEFHFKNRFGLV